MRAPFITLIALVTLVAALWWSSRGALDRASAAAPLARDAGAAAVTVAGTAGDADGQPMLGTRPRSDSAAGADTVLEASAIDVVEMYAESSDRSEATETDGAAHPYPPTAWAAYDPRAERNARYRAESLPRALAGLTDAGVSASLRVAYAISIETAAIFSELDERRESFYVPDDGQRHPLAFAEGHHSVACGGANYFFAEGRYPLYDALVRLEDSSSSSPELRAWDSACPLEAALRSRCDEALQRLAAYR